MIRRFLRDEGGATAIEYAFLASLVAIAILIALQALGTTLSSTFQEVSTKMNNAIP